MRIKKSVNYAIVWCLSTFLRMLELYGLRRAYYAICKNVRVEWKCFRAYL